MPNTILVLTAHPADAEFFAGGTLAKRAADGDELTVLIATNGEKRSFELDAGKLAEVRRMEALRAAGVLGVREVVFLDHPDGELDRLEPGRLRERFVRAIREHRPDVLFAFDPFAPFEEHPDHRAAAFAAMEAAFFAPYPLYYPDQLAQGLDPHRVTRQYLFAKHPVHANTAVDISETLQVKIAAILAHESQVAFLCEDWRRQAALQEEGEHTPKGVDPAQEIARTIQEWARSSGAASGLEFAERFRCPQIQPSR